MKALLKTIALCAALFSGASFAAETATKADTSGTSKQRLVYTVAEVRRIDVTNRKLTLKHAEIKNLDMPPMTMVFVVKDLALIEGLKVGDRVRFVAINDNGVFTVTHLKPTKRPK
jgi:Cu(I)/Ag(I) efflux system periplasmic protein CusF